MSVARLQKTQFEQLLTAVSPIVMEQRTLGQTVCPPLIRYSYPVTILITSTRAPTTNCLVTLSTNSQTCFVET